MRSMKTALYITTPQNQNTLCVSHYKDMSHRKVHSQGNVPFSWEEEPGISKVTHQKFPSDIHLHALDLPPPPQPPLASPPCHSKNPNMVLPPCPSKPPRRSTSLKGLSQQEDPFLAAYKECTKSVRIGKLPSESKRSGAGSSVKKSLFGFSCKRSCDIRDDNFVRLARLPPLPTERIRRLR